MKKAKIIIPALAAIALSTVASVTGTVAWFTSQSSASIETTYFTVSGLDGELKTSYAAGVGTQIKTAGDKTSVSLKDGAGLTHGSFDYKTEKVWTLDPFSDPSSLVYINKENAHLGDGLVENDFKEVAEDSYLLYNAITWKVTFTYGKGTEWNFGSNNTFNLYFDFRSDYSKATLDPAKGQISDGVANAARGFRIAVVNENEWVDEQAKDEHVACVWSPLQGKKMSKSDTAAESDPASSRVVSTSATEAYSPTANGDLIYKGEQGVELSYISGGEGTKNRADYVGSFNEANKGNITLTFVAWYEGCDVLNVNTNATDALPAVAANMTFYLRRNSTN